MWRWTKANFRHVAVVEKADFRLDQIATKKHIQFCATEYLRQIQEKQLLWGSLCLRFRIMPRYNRNILT